MFVSDLLHAAFGNNQLSKLSSGYTVDEKTGNRYVFYLNKKRFPDFKEMNAVYHRAGMKVATNVKPCAT